MQLVIIGDRLSKDEALLRSGPFSGIYAKRFSSLLAKHSLSPVYFNAWETDKIGDFSVGRKFNVLARTKPYNPKIILLLGEATAKLFGLFDLVESDRNAFENLVNFWAKKDDIWLLPTFHPRECMKQSHWGYYLEASVVKALDALNSPKFELHNFNIKPTRDLIQIETHITKTIQSELPLCLDIETRFKKTKTEILMGAKKKKVVAIDNTIKSIAWGVDVNDVCVVSDDQFGPQFLKDCIKRLGDPISDPNRVKVGQNVFFDFWNIWNQFGIRPRGPVHDTLHMSNILRDYLPKSLNWLAKLYLHIEPWKGGHKYTGADLRLYNAQDVAYTLFIHNKMLAEFDAQGKTDYWKTYRRELFESTFDMATYGILIDQQKREAYRAPAIAELAEIHADLNAVAKGHIPAQQIKKWVADPAKNIKTNLRFDWVKANKKAGIVGTNAADFKAFLLANGIKKPADFMVDKKTGEVFKKAKRQEITVKPRETFNPASSQQKAAVLKSLGIKLEKTKKTEDKDTTASTAIRKTLALQSLTEVQQKFLLNLLAYSDYSKMISTYYFMPLSVDGRMRYSYNLEGAETGRSTSSKAPDGTGGNSQNFPRSGKAKVNFKDLIIPSPGKILMQRDQLSAESVVVAYRSACGAMIEEFQKDEPDFHTLVAKLIHPQVSGVEYDAEPKDKKKSLRQGYKPVSHGASYGLFPRMLQELLFMATNKFVQLAEAEKYLNSWLAAFPEVKKWHHRTKNILDFDLELVNAFGRKHKFGGIKTFNALNEMLAWEPQSTVPELTNIMLKWCYELNISRPELGVQVVQMGHDALLIELYESAVLEFVQLFDHKSSSIKLSYPSGETSIKWDCAVGASWGQLIKLSEWSQSYASNNIHKSPTGSN